MAWDKQYWDTISNIYWNPKYIGLQSMKLKSLEQNNECFFVPRKRINLKGPLYTRTRVKTFEEQCEKLKREEENLNHCFNFTFSIAPDALIDKLFCSNLSFADRGPFDFVGWRELSAKFWLENKNVGQHDALLASVNSLIAIELKTGAMPSPGQMVKYVLVLAQLLKDRRTPRNFGLLFICPEGDEEKVLSSCGLATPRVPPDYIENHVGSVNEDVRTELKGLSGEVAQVLGQLTIGMLSWTRLHGALCEVREQLNSRRPSQQTIRRLLDGFLHILGEQARTGIPREQVEAARPAFADVMDIATWAAKLEDGSQMTPEGPAQGARRVRVHHKLGRPQRDRNVPALHA